MTRKVFWEDPYQTSLNTTVISVSNDKIIINETIFFAESGGQESDHGSINGLNVLKAETRGNDIIYTLSPDHGLSVDDQVFVQIDWERRHKLMKLHFGAEVVLEIINDMLNSPRRIGAHISPLKARIDFEWNESITPLLPAITDKSTEIFNADTQIIKGYSDEENQRRFWEVEGFAKVPCGGTHLSKTGEIGGITLKRKNIGKGKERVEITLAN